MTTRYPQARRDEEANDVHFGTPVKDHYRWLEDSDSDETKTFVDDQVKITQDYFNKHCADRPLIRRRMEDIYNYVKMGCPFKEGKFYYFFKNDGLQNQAILYQQDTDVLKEGAARVFLDMNTFAADGTASLGTTSFSKDGKYMAYTVSRAGSDWMTAFVRDTETGKDLPQDKLEWIKFSSLSWTHDNKGFFYSRYPAPESVKANDPEDKRGSESHTNINNTSYYHVVGKDQKEDIAVYGPLADHPKYMYSSNVAHDGNYVLISVSESTAPVNKLYFAELNPATKALDMNNWHVVKFIDNFDAQYEYVANIGSKFWFNTNLKAPKSKVISHDVTLPIPKDFKFEEVIPENSDPISWVTSFCKDSMLAVTYMHNVSEFILLYDMKGKAAERIDMPALGTVQSFSGKHTDDYFYFKFTSFLYPGSIYHYDIPSRKMSLWYETQVKGFTSSDYEVKQVFYKSKDGTSIPMFIMNLKGLPFDGNNPTLLYGYGGFSISLLPSYSALRLIFLQNYKGVIAIPNLRGGGEFGEDWHNAGIKDKKQNVFDDFIAAAEYLIANKYTRPAKLAINGGSNGGLLVGACTNQRPDLYACAVAEVGVMDMLRFHKFTIGHFWVADYGSAEASESEFKALLAYSPLHNIRPPTSPNVTYPSVLVCTSDHDDRVVPLHSLKYIAQLQYVLGSLPNQKRPLLARIEKQAGHGAGKPTSKILDEQADKYAFIIHALEAQSYNF